MPIQHAIWKVGARPELLTAAKLPSEQQLEDMIVRDPRILSSEWLIIGRQIPTAFGGRIDLVAIAPDASLVLIELKRDRTPREVVAQALDYASWVDRLTPSEIAKIYRDFSNGGSLDSAFRERFGASLDEDDLNASHQIILVASELDPSTERIIAYLNEREIAINAVFFQVFQLGQELLLSRAWFLDPGDTQANVATTTRQHGEKEPWNGEFYVSFGDRSWEDARRFGFISGGGGSWYSQTLKMLSPGDRVWVKIPGHGYVGVGRVVEPMQAIDSFKARTPEGERLLLEVSEWARKCTLASTDPERAEYLVRVEWLDTVDASRAVREVGLFGNQNTVCRPQTPLWRHTVDRLKTYFPAWDSGRLQNNK